MNLCAQAGVYQIVNLANGKRYVGSARKFRQRWAEHRSMLARGVHHNASPESRANQAAAQLGKKRGPYKKRAGVAS